MTGHEAVLEDGRRLGKDWDASSGERQLPVVLAPDERRVLPEWPAGGIAPCCFPRGRLAVRQLAGARLAHFRIIRARWQGAMLGQQGKARLG